MSKGIIALDADGVLLDYSLAYASAWERAFGVYPQEKDLDAYWPIDRWRVDRVTGERLERFRAAFDETFWASVPAIDGAVQACHELRRHGYDLVCVTAVAQKFLKARQQNLRTLGFPLTAVYATEHREGERSPKADVLQELRPAAFVDDYLPYLAGVHQDIHAALIVRGRNGAPNADNPVRSPDSRHSDLAAFSQWWLERHAG